MNPQGLESGQAIGITSLQAFGGGYFPELVLDLSVDDVAVPLELGIDRGRLLKDFPHFPVNVRLVDEGAQLHGASVREGFELHPVDSAFVLLGVTVLL